MSAMINDRRAILRLLALPIGLMAVLPLTSAALADDHEERERDREHWRREHEERRDRQWREEEHEERRARAEADLRERRHEFYRERRWVGQGYYYDGSRYVYLAEPPPPHFWVEVEPPPPSVDIIVPLRLRF